MNAAIALNLPAADIVAPFDSVMLCLSKGLGAPVGAMLCGSAAFIKSARRLRKHARRWYAPGWLAGGLWPVRNHDHNIARLADDHDRARLLAEGIGDIEGLPVECFTNMVFIKPQEKDLEPLRVHLQERQILIGQQNPPIRLVTHLDIDSAGIDRVITAIHSYYR